MADAGFDIVETETQIEDMFLHFSEKRLSMSVCRSHILPPVASRLLDLSALPCISS